MKYAEIENKNENRLFCFKCQKIPEILNVNIDNGKIEMKCKNCGIFECNVKDYIDRLNQQNINQCNCDSKKEVIYYCYECKENKCSNCKKSNCGKYKENEIHHYIEVTERRRKCPLHYKKDITKFCVDCQENLCSNCNMHKSHEKIDISELGQDSSISEDNITNEIKNIENIKEFNRMIIKNRKKEEIDKICGYIEEEKERNSKQIKFLLDSMEIKKNDNKKAITTLIDKKKFKEENEVNDEKLSLCNKEIDNKILHLISKIQFKNLRELDLSKNKIINIEPLTRMNLCNLLNLNLSINEIENIEAIPELNEENIQIINLDDNKIENINPFIEFKFPKLIELRIQNNKKIGESQKEKLKNKNQKLQLYS